MAEQRTIDEIQAEIHLEREKLNTTPPPPFEEQETILRRIIELLDERKEVCNGKAD